MSFSYSFGNEERNDSLVSTLNQYSLATRFGYNIIKSPVVVVSPYVGIRYTRFRHLTSLNDRKVSFDEYMLMRDIDLRVAQYTGAIGINSTFLIKEMLSVGFYASYLIDFSDNPIIRTNSNRIRHKLNNPIDDFVIGIGFGIGFNDFYN